jgi:hypothetical protein
MARWLLLVVALLCVAVAVACGKTFPLCKAGEFRACNCTDGSAGYQQCRDSEDDYKPCICNGGTPGLDAGVPLPKGDAGYLQPCKTGGDCQSGICGSFPSRGDKCTINCTSSDQCAAPSPGCNPQQLCRAP